MLSRMILQHREDHHILPARVLIGKQAARELMRSQRRLGLLVKRLKPGCLGMVSSVFVEYDPKLKPDEIRIIP